MLVSRWVPPLLWYDFREHVTAVRLEFWAHAVMQCTLDGSFNHRRMSALGKYPRMSLCKQSTQIFRFTLSYSHRLFMEWCDAIGNGRETDLQYELYPPSPQCSISAATQVELNE